MHRASAALRDAAAEFGAGHTEDVAKDPEQRHIRWRVERLLLAVDRQFYHKSPDSDVNSTQRSLHPVARQRQFSDALASRIGESIHDRGNRGPLRTFAGAERFLGWAVDELDFNAGHVGHCQDRIAVPITRGNPIAVEADLLVQRPTCRLDDATLNLIGQPVRVDDLTRISGCKGLRDLYHTACWIDLDFRDHRDVNRKSLIFGKSDTAAATSITDLTLFPVCLPGNRFDHRPRALILQLREPECYGIGVCHVCQFIDEGLDREHVGISAESAQRRGPQRHLPNEVLDDSLAGKIVERDRVAVAAARRLRDDSRRWRFLCLSKIPAREQIVATPAHPAASNEYCSKPRNSNRRSLRPRAQPSPA